ncbi:hypothetical protein R75461_07853 [Paraburkholderia nemoris]|nr:hypothetical protein [Paraburkholderia aspalathi]MBK3786862.1 hypothetical protein [Paraburkholderia aspalathi]CAE6858512.1 hypothetical protein R75461_07853 [Paraburkholderia nemoris]
MHDSTTDRPRDETAHRTVDALWATLSALEARRSDTPQRRTLVQGGRIMGIVALMTPRARRSGPDYGASGPSKTGSGPREETLIGPDALLRDSDECAGADQIERQLRTLRAHVCAQGMVLQALLTTHPRRHEVMESFRVQSLRHLGTLSSGGRLESCEAFDSARNHWLSLPGKW